MEERLLALKLKNNILVNYSEIKEKLRNYFISKSEYNNKFLRFLRGIPKPEPFCLLNEILKVDITHWKEISNINPDKTYEVIVVTEGSFSLQNKKNEKYKNFTLKLAVFFLNLHESQQEELIRKIEYIEREKKLLEKKIDSLEKKLDEYKFKIDSQILKVKKISRAECQLNSFTEIDFRESYENLKESYWKKIKHIGKLKNIDFWIILISVSVISIYFLKLVKKFFNSKKFWRKNN